MIKQAALRFTDKWLMPNETTLLNHPVNLISTFFKNFTKLKTPWNVNGVLYRIFYDHTGLESLKQIIVPDQVMLEMIRSLPSNPVQGDPGSKRMLRCYMTYVNATTPKCCWKNANNPRKLWNRYAIKIYKNLKLRPPLQKIHDPCNSPIDVEIWKLTYSDHCLHRTATRTFWPQSTRFRVICLLYRYVNLTQHLLLKLFCRYSPNTRTYQHTSWPTKDLFSPLICLNNLLKLPAKKISHATIKHAQTIAMVSRSHAKLKKSLKIYANVDRPQWDC